MGGVFVDVQAAQSRAHSERGIARYTLDLCAALERLAPDLVDSYVVNPDLPMHASLEVLSRTGKVRRIDHEIESGRPAEVYHVSSPIEPVGVDRILPRPLVGSRTRIIATVYDLIPLIYPEVYLTDPTVRRNYTSRLGIIQSADRLLAISQTTAADTARMLDVAENRVTPIYGGAGRAFEPAALPRHEIHGALCSVLPSIESDYLLVPSGIEWRKNLGRLIEAYALLVPELRDAHQLVVQCRVSEQDRLNLIAHAQTLGVADRLLVTGFVSDETLVRLYQLAGLVVFPSLYEGLGLPVLEARRCGAPVICSSTSSLVEVVPDADAHFDPTSVESIAERMESVLSQPSTLERLRVSPVPPQFDWDVAARRYAEALREERRLHGRPRRPEVAIVTPVPPQPCGPATYANHLISALAELWNLTVFVTIDPADVMLDADVRVEPLSLLEQIETFEHRFDEVIYFFGNSEFHQLFPIFLRRRPGVAVLHDARLTGMYTELCRGRPDILGDLGTLLHDMYPGRYPDELGRAGHIPPEEAVRFGVLMAQGIAEDATRVLVHSEHAAGLIELDAGIRPDVGFELPFVPFGGNRRPEPNLVVSFGIVAPPKQSDLLVEALAHVPQAHLALVGPVDETYRRYLDDLAVNLEVSDRLTMTGILSDDEYRGWIERAQIAVQLRKWSNGESSAALADTLAAGIPTVVSEVGTFHEIADDLVVKVEPDLPAARLGAALAALLHDPAAAEAMGQRGRRHAERNTYSHAARRLQRLLFGAGTAGGARRSVRRGRR